MKEKMKVSWKNYYKIAVATKVAAVLYLPIVIFLWLILPWPMVNSGVIFFFLAILIPATPMIFLQYKMEKILCPACGKKFHETPRKGWFREQTHCASCGIEVGKNTIELP